MSERPLLAAMALAVLAGGFVWARSARRLHRVARRIEVGAGTHTEVSRLARISFRKDLHTAGLYVVAALGLAAAALTDAAWAHVVQGLIIVPVLVSIYYAQAIWNHARLTESRSNLEQRSRLHLLGLAQEPAAVDDRADDGDEQ